MISAADIFRGNVLVVDDQEVNVLLLERMLRNAGYPNFFYTTRFIGPRGVLAEVHGRQATYRFAATDAWVRARVFCSSGRMLWTQPIWI